MRTSQSADALDSYLHGSSTASRETPPPLPSRPPPSLPSRPAPPVPGKVPLVPQQRLPASRSSDALVPSAVMDLSVIAFMDASMESADFSRKDTLQPSQTKPAVNKGNPFRTNLEVSDNTVAYRSSPVSLHASSSANSLENKFSDTASVTSQSSGGKLSDYNDNFAAPSSADTASISSHAAPQPPIPAKRSSLLRRNAFNKTASRPSSLARASPVQQPLATHAQAIPAARTAFMQSEVIAKTSLTSARVSSNSLDDFDPLSTGQLVCDEQPGAADVITNVRG